MASSLTQPSPLTVPFADAGNKRTIPTASQIGVTDGAASYVDGFPPLTMTPLASGGVPPSGLDFNGILHAVTTLLRWVGAGGQATFNSTLAAAIGGYPVGAVLLDNSGENSYVNVVDGNSTDFNDDPSAIGDSWLPYAGPEALPGQATTTTLGILKTATNAITQLGTSAETAVTPLSLWSFGKNHAVSGGYQKLPGGLMLQWGKEESDPNERGIITFPQPFIATVLNVQTTAMNNGETNLGLRPDPYDFTATGFSYWMNNNYPTVTQQQWTWLALGRWA